MTVMEITLLVLGVVIFALSFIIPDKKGAEKNYIDKDKMREDVRHLVEQELSSMTVRVNEATDETVEYAMEKSERSLEKISNEKIMAVNEYSQTIVEELNKRHQEVMFLYDMLNDKQVDLKNTVRKAEATAKEVETLSTEAQVRTEELNKAIAKPEPVYDPYNMSYEQAYAPVKEAVDFYNNNVEALKERFLAMTKQEEELAAHEAQVKAQAQIKHVHDLTDQLAAANINNETLKKTSVPAQNSQMAQPTVTPKKKQPMFSMFNAQIQSDLNSDGGQTGFKNVPWEEVNVAQATPAPVPVAAPVAAKEPVGQKVEAPKSPFGKLSGSSNNNRKILELYRQGMDTVEIAKELNLGVGEIKLVIDLFEG